MNGDHSLISQIKQGIYDMCHIWAKEMRSVFADEGVLLFFIFLQYSMIWSASLPIVTRSIHSLNTHPAIVVIHEKIDMQTCIILFSIVLPIHHCSL